MNHVKVEKPMADLCRPEPLTKSMAATQVDRAVLQCLRDNKHTDVSRQRLQSLACTAIPGLTPRRFANSLSRLLATGKVKKSTPHRLRCTALGRRPKPVKKPVKKSGKKTIKKPVKTTSKVSPRPAKKRGQYTPSACKGLVDSGFNLATSYTVLRTNISGSEQLWDAMFVQRDLARGIDKYFAMQLLVPKQGETQIVDVILLTRWGRTGTSGTLHTTTYDPLSLDKAQADFQKKSREKTGSNFVNVVRNEQPDATDVIWQYYVDDGVDNKATGWYDYDTGASRIVENIYREHQLNPQMDVRRVQSGKFAYHVDFGTLTQTNVTHDDHKQRCIRRQAVAN